MRTNLDLGIIGAVVPSRNPLDALPLFESAKQDDAALAASEQARNDAIQRAHDHANAQWKQTAYAAICEVARRNPLFTSDAVWAHLQGAKPATHEPSAIGPLFLLAAKHRICMKTGRYVRSTSTDHHRDVAEWQSLICDATEGVSRAS